MIDPPIGGYPGEQSFDALAPLTCGVTELKWITRDPWSEGLWSAENHSRQCASLYAATLPMPNLVSVAAGDTKRVQCCVCIEAAATNTAIDQSVVEVVRRRI